MRRCGALGCKRLRVRGSAAAGAPQERAGSGRCPGGGCPGGTHGPAATHPELSQAPLWLLRGLSRQPGSVSVPPVALTLLSPSLRRLVYDRETGKPKGYGFCEYQDQETALSAMRNLNGREFSGRALRVDNAASEKNKEELKSESRFGSGEK